MTNKTSARHFRLKNVIKILNFFFKFCSVEGFDSKRLEQFVFTFHIFSVQILTQQYYEQKKIEQLDGAR